MTTTHAVFHPLAVASIEPLTDDSVAITFDGARRTCATTTRSATASTSPSAPSSPATTCAATTRSARRRRPGCCGSRVKRLPGGAFSEHALDVLRPGDVLDVMTPTGRFFTELDPAHRKHYVCVAAGSGITPILSIVASTLEAEPLSSVTLVYANRTHKSVMFLEEVEDLKDSHPDRFQLLHVLSREPQEVELFSGRLDADRMGRILDGLLPPDTVDEWFLCGPFEMVSDLRKLLVERGRRQEGDPRRGVPRRVGSAASVVRRWRPRDAEGAQVTITLDGRDLDVPLPTDGPAVLDAALAGARRRAVRLQGRRVRHLPGQGARGHRRDGHQLGAGARGGRARLRADLPVAPDLRAGRPRLRRLRTRPRPPTAPFRTYRAGRFAGPCSLLDGGATALDSCLRLARVDPVGTPHPTWRGPTPRPVPLPPWGRVGSHSRVRGVPAARVAACSSTSTSSSGSSTTGRRRATAPAPAPAASSATRCASTSPRASRS